MLHRDRIVALYDVHSWAGLLFSVLIFILCVSGALAVFSTELDRWANPSLRVDLSKPLTVDADRAVEVFAANGALRPDRPLQLALPGAHAGMYSIPATTQTERLNRLYLDGTSGQITAPRQAYMYWYLRHLHVRLMNHWYGRVFIGFIGVAMLLSIVTGILIHQHPIRGLFRMRWKPGKGPRALLADIHKWLGVWGMLFHFVIAFSGTWLGLEYAILAPPVAVAKFDGNVAAAQDAFSRKRAPAAEERAAMVKLAALLERSSVDLPGFVPASLQAENWGRTNAVVTIQGHLPYTLVAEYQSHVRYSGVTGELLAVRDVRRDTVWEQIASAMKPLHYGYFGGIWLKVMYLIMGMMPAALSLSGALIWFERRQRLQHAAGVPGRYALTRRTVVAMFASGWLAFLIGLVVPPVWASVGGHIGSDPMTPLFWLPWLGLWPLLTLLRDERQIGAWTMSLAAALLALGFATTWRPPLDLISATVGISAAGLIGLHIWLWRLWSPGGWFRRNILGGLQER